MRISLKVIMYLMTGDKPPVIQKARHGGSATIKCQYPRTEESNIKHFCREDGNFNCTNLISTVNSNHTILGRFSLTNDKRQGVYTVIISTLTQDDAGRYRCVMERADSSTACLTKIHLHILNWDDITSKAINHAIGEAAQIRCLYPDSHNSNEKFLCKGENPSNCEELIHTSDQETDFSKGRFSIRDRMKYFYVYIKNLSTEDSGSYWCGSSRMWEQAEVTKILLSVAERRKTRESVMQLNDNAVTVNNSTDGPVTKDWLALVVAVVVCLVLILLLVLVLVLCRHNLPCKQEGSLEQRTSAAEHTTEENHGDHHFDEIQTGNLQASSEEALTSVYANVNLPADQLQYASVNFRVGVSTDRNSLPGTNEISSNSTSQGVTHPSAAEQTVYSTVTKPGEP
ncbi:polymeric immunoglobulin receptor-like isoform X2 [Perca flavescens]|uniref:polymeric immunoglobulin receptor-like isoform X2 n=1 Tax=Perca flavescens TaxID=8167 RepID=UPI00106E2064|nr:polymeric immunoglobulin receptor-like isoform X2 [Perca flavescens]